MSEIKRVPIRIQKGTNSNERKDRRVGLLVRPSVCEKAAKILYYERDTLDNLINVLLEEYVEKHADLVEKFDKEFPNGIPE